MGQTEASRQSDFITAPLAGQISVLTAGAAASQDLRLCGLQLVANDSEPNTPGLIGTFVSFEADGGDIYVCFGPTSASVSGANAPASAARGVNVAGGCIKIPDGAILSAKLRPNIDNFVGYVGSGALRIAQSSTKS